MTRSLDVRPGPGASRGQTWSAVSRRSASAGLGLLLVLVAVVATIASHVVSAQIDTAGRSALLADRYQDARFFVATEDAAVDSYRVEPTAATRAKHAAAAASAVVSLVVLQTAQDRSGAGGDSTLLASLIAVHQSYVVVAQQIFQLTDAGEQTQAKVVDSTRLEPLRSQLEGGLGTLEAHHDLLAVAATASAHRVGLTLLWGTPILLVSSLLLIASLWWIRRAHRRSGEHEALHDRLTGLPNRALFTDRATQLLANADRSGSKPAVMMVNLDKFKDVNDTLGRHHGDELLVQLATRLTALLRSGDTVARLGGDEFGLLLTGGGDTAAADIAARIIASLEEPFGLGGIAVGVEASIGIASTESSTTDTGRAADKVADLIRKADAAMYQAKAERCGFTIFDRAAELTTTRHMALLGELRLALERDELVLHFQPKVASQTGELLGVEALVRWQHPERGLLPPADFIGLAEGTTLIHRLTNVVVDKALSFSRGWLERGVRIPVAVNVSARSLLDKTFATNISARLTAHDVAADLLWIELTEGTVMSDPDRAIAVLGELRKIGIRLSVDDFGTGYSSMTYLKVLPVDELKVDRSFVQGMTTNHSDAVLVQSAIDLGHNLGLSVVAEGVEDAATLQALRNCGADVVQGYFIGRPMPEHILTKWIAERTTPPGWPLASHGPRTFASLEPAGTTATPIPS